MRGERTDRDRTPTCRVCGGPIAHAPVTEPGLCGPCDLRLRLRQLAPEGSRCTLCGERRRRALTLWAPSGQVVCHSCAFYLREMRPWPERVELARPRLARERRAVPRGAPRQPRPRPSCTPAPAGPAPTDSCHRAAAPSGPGQLDLFDSPGDP